jgi:hypothetical protein
MTKISSYRLLRADLLQQLLYESDHVEVDTWHAQDVSGKPEMVSQEILHTNFAFPVVPGQEVLQIVIEPNMPWAEDHFKERISGQPLNPSPSEAWWPYAVRGNAQHKEGDKFSHTYPERYWPAQAGRENGGVNYGIRYVYGDLYDVIQLLREHPLTRQAYMPVWFPEDTGAISGQRVPCSIGYHFIQRRGKLDLFYFIRSCDFLRHFADDMYMTARLLQYVVGMLQGYGQQVSEGNMHVHITSLHYFVGDRDYMVKLLDDWEVDQFD